MLRRHLVAAVLAAGALSSGCETLGYYAQAVRGQGELMLDRRCIQELLASPATDEALRSQLRTAEEIRDFATEELSLPDNGSYRSYVELGREAMVWSLVSTPEFSVHADTWCYPMIGCASYRGYFHRADAELYARRLAAKGRDVALEPVPAYSTLGWLADPLPSTLIRWPDWRLAELIFHELAHQELYVHGDSSFNEAFATLVARTGVERWLSAEDRESSRRAWVAHLARERDFVALLLSARQRLDELYREPLDPEVLRRRKELEWARLRSAYRGLRKSWGGDGGLDAWLNRGPLNNARLASVATYEELVPALHALLRRNGGDLPAFYAACRRLGRLTPERRRNELESLQMP